MSKVETESWKELNIALDGKYEKDINVYFRRDEYEGEDEMYIEILDGINNEYDKDCKWAILLKPDGTWRIS